MTQVFAEDGSAVPVTVLQAGPCAITQIKTLKRDGYSALQIGFGGRKPKNVNRPTKGHLDKAGKGYFIIKATNSSCGNFITPYYLLSVLIDPAIYRQELLLRAVGYLGGHIPIHINKMVFNFYSENTIYQTAKDCTNTVGI